MDRQTDLLAPAQGPRERGKKKKLTHLIWLNFRKNNFLTPAPLRHPTQYPPSPIPGAWPMWQNENPIWYVISFICEKTHKVWFENLWNWFCNWNLMIFDLFCPSPGPQVVGPKICAVARPILVSYSHTKFGWIWSNGLGDSMTDRRMDRQTFWSLPRERGKKNCAVAHPIHVSNSHTKFGWISSNGLGVDSMTVWQTEAIAISPLLF